MISQNINDFLNIAASTQALNDGIELYSSKRIIHAEIDPRKRIAIVKIKDTFDSIVDVKISEYQTEFISTSCTCGTQSHKLCKHEVAALLYIKNNYLELLSNYNAKYSPSPDFLSKDTTFIRELIHYYSNDNTIQLKLLWLNPLLQRAIFINNRQRQTIVKYFFSSLIEVKSFDEENKLSNKYSALKMLADIIESENFFQKLQSFKRKNGALLIGKTEEIKQHTLRAVLPYYLPEEFELKKIAQNEIELSVKVRYKYRDVIFKITNNKLYSKCSCSDDVPSICKHQIAALHLLTELNPAFFKHLTNPEMLENLKSTFI